MWDVFARLKLVALGLGVLAVGSVVEASTISFKAVKKNDVAITPTNNLSVLASDKIEVELFLSNWKNDFPVDSTPNNVRGFQVKLNRAGFVSPIPGNGSAKPLGWCGPVDKISCAASLDCLVGSPAYPVCLTIPPTGCTCTPHTPDAGGFITHLRTDFVLFGLDGQQPTCVTQSIDYSYYGIADAIGTPDTTPSTPRYLGTLILKMSANACGTFTIGFVQEINSTFIVDPATFKPNVSLPTLQPLILTVSSCSRQLLSCDPGHCNVDARIPHDRLEPAIKLNTNSMKMTFSQSTVGMTAADFEVTLAPSVPGDIVPLVSAVTPNGVDPRIATITLSRRIQQTRWTCIREKGSNKRCCMGSLPGDVDGDRIVASADSFELLDNLRGCLNPPTCNEPPLSIERCDIDRSRLCTSADLLIEVDLLNDDILCDPGPCFPTTLPECPDMRLPP